MATQNFLIEKSPLWKDITKIISSNAKTTFSTITATIHTEKEDYSAMFVDQIDLSRDYTGNIGDELFITFRLSFGDYVFRFYPFIKNLELTITQLFLNKEGLTNQDTQTKYKQRFKAVFLPNENLHVNVSEFQSMDKVTLDHLQIVTVKMQLLNRCLEPLRILFTQGIYQKIKPETFLRTVIGEKAQGVLVDGKPALDAIDIYKPDNEEIQAHINIPNHTQVISLPTYLQKQVCGVYSSGLGSYFQYYNKKNTFFIFPIYNTNRYKNDKSQSAKAIFYFIPSYRYAGIDNTYNLDGKVLSILCTSDKKFIDDGDTRYMDEGVGFVQADARAFMGKPTVINESGPKGNPARLTTFAANTSRQDGLNYTPTTKVRISSNPFEQYSLVAQRNISIIHLNWEHSDSSLIYPGMPCEFVYLDQGKRKTIQGIIAKLQSFTVKTNTGPLTGIFIQNTALIIYAQRQPDVTSVPQDLAIDSTIVSAQ